MGSERFDENWARAKLDMPRRRRELEAYIQRWLPKLKSMEPGLVIDIGCGPGDFLAICREMGHDVLGIDAPDGRGGMGEAYQKLAREHCERFGVEVYRLGLMQFLTHPSVREPKEQCVLINARGSIEQALHFCMIGELHDEHHQASRLDWQMRDDVPGSATFWFDTLCRHSYTMLRPGGVLLIAANGSRSTDGFYDDEIRIAAQKSGLLLVEQQGKLTHKWVRP